MRGGKQADVVVPAVGRLVGWRRSGRALPTERMRVAQRHLAPSPSDGYTASALTPGASALHTSEWSVGAEPPVGGAATVSCDVLIR